MILYTGRYQIKTFFFKYFNLTAKNIGIIFVASSLVNLINFFYQIIMGRILGPSEYGVLTTLISLLYIAGALSGTIQTSVTRYITTYNAQNNMYKIKNFFSKITIRFFILACFIFILLVSLLKPVISFLRMESSLPLIILGIVIIEGSVGSVTMGTIQGMSRFKALGFNSILGNSLKLILGLLFIYLGFKSFGAVIGILLSGLFAYLIILFSIRDILRLKIPSNIDTSIDIKDFYKSTMMILISTALITLISYFDIVLVKHFFSSENTGFFSAASQIGRIILFFPGAVGIVIFPRFSEKFEKNESLRGTFLKSFLILMFTSIFLLAIYFFFPEFITKIMFGNSYIYASKLILIYGLFMTVIGFINLQVLYFISIKKFWYLIYLFIFFIIEVILIFNYHKTLKMILLIEILISILIFIINTFIMLILSKRLRALRHG